MSHNQYQKKIVKNIIRIPHASVGEVLGLVELLANYGGEMRIYELVDELQMDIDDLGDVIDMAELLNLVKVKDGKISLTLYGENVCYGTIDDKKRVLHRALKYVEPFKTAHEILKKRKVVSETTLMKNLEKKFHIDEKKHFHKLFTNWGSFAELFEYDADDHIFRVFH